MSPLTGEDGNLRISLKNVQFKLNMSENNKLLDLGVQEANRQLET